MSKDRYYPPASVEKVKAELVKLVDFLEGGPRPVADVQAFCDTMTEAINGLEDEMELETVAREDIAETVGHVFDTYGVEIDLEEALRNREW
jgi:hypothetical protein